MFSEKALDTCRYFCIVAAIAAPIFTAATSVIIVCILLFWLASGQAIHTLIRSWQQPIGKIILLFVSWLIVGIFYADTDWNTKIETLSSWKKLFFAYLLLGFFHQREWQKRFVDHYTMAMIVLAVISFFLWSTDFSIRPDRGNGAGVIMTTASSQSTAFTAALLRCIFGLSSTKNKYAQYYFCSGIILFLTDIFFVDTARSSYLAVPIATIVAVGSLFSLRQLPYIVAIIGAILLGFCISSTTLQERFKLAFDEQSNYQTSAEKTSVGTRIIFYKNTSELIKKKPWFGYGTSSFESIYSPFAASKSQGWQGWPTADPHNQYLFVWLENGLFGLLLFFAYIFVAIRQGLKNAPYGAIAASFLIAITVSSLFNSHFKTFSEGYLLAFFLGALLTADPSSPKPQPEIKA